MSWEVIEFLRMSGKLTRCPKNLTAKISLVARYTILSPYRASDYSKSDRMKYSLRSYSLFWRYDTRPR